MKDLYGEIIIPNAVRDEVTVKNTQCLDGHDWVRATAITNFAVKEMFTSALHDGEVEVILLAKEVDAALVIMDDGLARRHAKYLGLTVTGTVGVLLRAKSAGIITELTPILDNLIQNNFYISDNLYCEVLSIAGE